MTSDAASPPDLTRRGLLRGAAVGAVTLPLLSGCGGFGARRPVSTKGPLAATSDVPVGSGVIIGNHEVVLTQPSAGEYRCFSAVCTHQGCLVGRVTGTEIVCPCHNSVFSIKDGSVLDGPASAPLPRVSIRVHRGEVIGT
jgi:nitrite reductase/ring-hydroxylating ferredoxin subunit